MHKRENEPSLQAHQSTVLGVLSIQQTSINPKGPKALDL